MLEILLPVAGVIVGAILSYFVVKPRSKQLQAQAEQEAKTSIVYRLKIRNGCQHG